MDEITKLSNNLIDSIDKDQIKELSTDSLEIILDSTLNEGLLKDIPIIGSIVKLIELGANIKDQIFAKKILRFLFKLSEVSVHERGLFIGELNTDPKLKTSVGNQLILIIEKLDDFNKPEILANLFSSYIENKISYKEFILASNALDKFLLIYQEELHQIYAMNYPLIKETEPYDHLFNSGLLGNVKNREVKGNNNHPMDNYDRNKAGEILTSFGIIRSSEQLKKQFISGIENLNSYDQSNLNPNQELVEIKWGFKNCNLAEAKSILDEIIIDLKDIVNTGWHHFQDTSRNWKFRRIGPNQYQFYWVLDKPILPELYKFQC